MPPEEPQPVEGVEDEDAEAEEEPIAMEEKAGIDGEPDIVAKVVGMTEAVAEEDWPKPPPYE